MIQGREANVYKYIYEFIYVRIYIMKPTSCEFSVAQAYCGSKCRSCYGYSISSTADVVTIHTELLTLYVNFTYPFYLCIAFVVAAHGLSRIDQVRLVFKLLLLELQPFPLRLLVCLAVYL
jgi:hypothetical protein